MQKCLLHRGCCLLQGRRGRKKKGRSLVYRKELLKAACLSSSFFPCLSFLTQRVRISDLTKRKKEGRRIKHALGVVGWMGGGGRGLSHENNILSDGVTQCKSDFYFDFPGGSPESHGRRFFSPPPCPGVILPPIRRKRWGKRRRLLLLLRRRCGRHQAGAKLPPGAADGLRLLERHR